MYFEWSHTLSTKSRVLKLINVYKTSSTNFGDKGVPKIGIREKFHDNMEIILKKQKSPRGR